MGFLFGVFFFFSSRRRHTRYWRDWSSDVCSSDLTHLVSPEMAAAAAISGETRWVRSEEHTSELQSRQYLVCRLLLEKKKKTPKPIGKLNLTGLIARRRFERREDIRREDVTSYDRQILFFFNDTATTEIYTLSLHDALPI